MSVLLILLLGAFIVSWATPRLPDARADTARIETQSPKAAVPDQDKHEAAEHAAAGLGPTEPKERQDRPEHQAKVESATLAVAEKSAELARNQLAEARAALKKAEREAKLAHAQAEETRIAKLAAEEAADKTRLSLAAAQKEVEEARGQAELERARRITAEQAAGRPRRRVAGYRHRYRASRRQRGVWCYGPYAPPSSNRAARLVGFCKG